MDPDHFAGPDPHLEPAIRDRMQPVNKHKNLHTFCYFAGGYIPLYVLLENFSTAL